MAARGTRSASRAVRNAEAVATGPLGALSHDALGVIFDGLADPLHPVVAVALSSTCKGLRTPLLAALELLQERHARAVALCNKVGLTCAALSYTQVATTCAALSDVYGLSWTSAGLNADDMATLGMILRTSGLPRLVVLDLMNNSFGEAGMKSLCEGLGSGGAPELRVLMLGQQLGTPTVGPSGTIFLDHGNVEFGPAGAEALADVLHRSALPQLSGLSLAGAHVGSRGLTALAAPLRKLPALRWLSLNFCEIGDEGVASLVGDLGKDDFKALNQLHLTGNLITDTGMTKLAGAIDGGGMPKLVDGEGPLQGGLWKGNLLAAAAAGQAVHDALAKRQGAKFNPALVLSEFDV